MRWNESQDLPVVSFPVDTTGFIYLFVNGELIPPIVVSSLAMRHIVREGVADTVIASLQVMCPLALNAIKNDLVDGQRQQWDQSDRFGPILPS